MDVALLLSLAPTSAVSPEERRAGTDTLKVGISLPRLKASVFWKVTISSAGVAFCDRTFVNGVSPGLMLMRVDRLSGEFSGTYVPNQENSRYRVYGVTLDPVNSP